MSGNSKEARNLHQQEPGRVESHAVAADTRILAQRKPARHTGGTSYTITTSESDTFVIVISGRARWALEQLRSAGAEGCTSLNTPAPRMAAYVHSLRGMGVEIETITELHKGDYPGHHARYVLRSSVSREQIGGAK